MHPRLIASHRVYGDDSWTSPSTMTAPLPVSLVDSLGWERKNIVNVDLSQSLLLCKFFLCVYRYHVFNEASSSIGSVNSRMKGSLINRNIPDSGIAIKTSRRRGKQRLAIFRNNADMRCRTMKTYGRHAYEIYYVRRWWRKRMRD